MRCTASSGARLRSTAAGSSHIFQDLHEKDLEVHSALRRFGRWQPAGEAGRDHRTEEVYNLGAQSHVRISFDEPVYTADIDALGTLRLLEAIRNVGGTQNVRFYQASSSEMYGKVTETPQSGNHAVPSAQPLCLRQGFRVSTKS